MRIAKKKEVNSILIGVTICTESFGQLYVSFL